MEKHIIIENVENEGYSLLAAMDSLASKLCEKQDAYGVFYVIQEKIRIERTIRQIRQRFSDIVI